MQKKTFKDFSSRIDQSGKIIGDATPEQARFYTTLGNIFYNCAYPLEKYEHQTGVNARALRAEIIQETKASFHLADKAADSIDRNDTRRILTSGLRAALAVTRVYVQNDTVIGNGHHSRQEAAANAIIKIHTLINGK